MRFFAATLGTETNTFSPLPTGRATFEECMLIPAGEHPDVPDMFTAPLWAARRYVEVHGGEVIQGLCAFATPAGPTVRAVYEELRDRLLDDLRRAMPVDAVALGLHGAMVADGYDDCEGDLLARVRDVVGPDVPVGAELDLHCHVSRAMADSADVLIAYKEYPHTDFLERGEELVRILAEAAADRVRPHTSVFDCRMIGMFFTTREPMASFVADMAESERRDGVLSVSAGHGFAYADVPDMGSTMIAVTDGRPGLGAEVARAFGERLYAMRREGTPAYLGVGDGVARALAAPAGPVVLADSSDNAGGGAGSDSTFVLRSLIEQGATGAAVAPIWDPVAVRLAMEAGEGARLDLRVGGKLGPQSGDPVDLRVRVRAICRDAEQYLGVSRSSAGDCVAVHADGLDLVLTSLRTQAFSPEIFTNVGIDPAGKRILVVKSSQHFHAGFAPLAAEVFYLDGPGSMPRDITRLPFRRIRRPMWPFDPNPLGLDPPAGDGGDRGGSGLKG